MDAVGHRPVTFFATAVQLQGGSKAGLELPDTVAVFSAAEVERREFKRNGEVVCAIYGRSFPSKQVTENLARDFERRSDDPLAVAVLHTNVGQLSAWDNYAPCSIEDLRAAENIMRSRQSEIA